MSPADPQQWSDEEILAGCRAGKEAYWHAFIERFSGLVHWSVRKVSAGRVKAGSEDFCREVFQDFFAKLIENRHLDDLKDPQRIRKFITVSAARMAQDRLKQTSRSTARHLPLDENIRTFAPGADVVSEDDERKLEMIDLALEDLTVKEKSILEFCYELDSKHEEIALLLGLPLDTVSSVIRRARQKIKKKFVENGFEGPWTD